MCKLGIKRQKLLLGPALAICIVGCSVLKPKPVELFQRRVPEIPARTATEDEHLRQAARAAKEYARQTVVTAIETQAAPEVINSATKTEVLTDAVAEAVGPPQTPSTREAEDLARLVLSDLARLERRYERFEQKLEQIEGKKVEGTGLVQLPYLTFVGLLLVLLIVVWGVLKAIALANPTIGVGVKAIQVGGSVIRRAFQQIIEGGEIFKQKIKQSPLAEQDKQYILNLFRTEQQKVQDRDVQEIVKQFTA